ILEDAGIKEAEAFLAVSSGDNSNIVSARVAREHYHVPRVIARINDPRRADIYERLNIPTIAPVRWGVRQAMLMLLHEGQDTQDRFAGGELLRVRVDVPAHLVGRPVSHLAEDGRVLVAGVERGGAAFVPSTNSTFQQGDVVQLILHQDALPGLE